MKLILCFESSLKSQNTLKDMFIVCAAFNPIIFVAFLKILQFLGYVEIAKVLQICRLRRNTDMGFGFSDLK